MSGSEAAAGGGARGRGGKPRAQLCDWCERPLTKAIDVYWIAGTAGFDVQGEPFVGAMTRALFCRRCAPAFSRILKHAWDRESDRIAGRSKKDMPDLRRRGKRPQGDRDLQGAAAAGHSQDDAIPGREGANPDDEG